MLESLMDRENDEDIVNLCRKQIEESMKAYDYPITKKKSLSETILSIFQGTTRTTRLGAIPTIETRQEILKRINYKLNEGKPFEVSCAWGAIKTVLERHKCVDLAELLAFSQYAAINRQIKQVYEPGVIFNLYMSDSYYEYLYGFDSEIANYCAGMVQLSMNYEGINPMYISESVRKIPDADMICEQNYQLLKKYWDETTGIAEEDFSFVSSYKHLTQAGWVGIIPVEMRDFYYKRMQSNYCDKDNAFWTEKILRFFSYGMFISQNDLMHRKDVGMSTVDSCLLRVPPPGLPRTLYSNRIRMRIAPQSVIKNSAPPWTVVGAVSVDRERKTHLRIIDSSIVNKISIKYGDYKGISFGIIYEEDYPEIFVNR